MVESLSALAWPLKSMGNSSWSTRASMGTYIETILGIVYRRGNVAGGCGAGMVGRKVRWNRRRIRREKNERGHLMRKRT